LLARAFGTRKLRAMGQRRIRPKDMTITLTRTQIDAALPKVAKGLQQYLWLQSKVAGHHDFHSDTEFRRKYNHFYRIRRAYIWQNTFYGLMARAKKEHLQFQVVLDALRESTGRVEASFASKLIATINPSLPVIDSVVLKNLGMRLPNATESDRILKVCKIHKRLSEIFKDFLQSDNGKYLVDEFRKKYPNANITDTKMLDLVLWQTRA
jgi:hypothetical protein